VPCKEDKSTKSEGDNIFTSQVTGCQVHANEKAIRPLFYRPDHYYLYTQSSYVVVLRILWDGAQFNAW